MLPDNLLKKIKKNPIITLIGPLFSKPDLHLLPKNSNIILIDGGQKYHSEIAKHLSIADLLYTVGDGDSSTGTMNHLLPKEKDYSDLKFVLQNLPTTVKNIHLFGFLGGRKDHELINLGEIQQYLTQNSNCTQIQFEDKIIGFNSGSHYYDINDTFSVVTMKHAELAISGKCKYQTNGQSKFYPFSSLGLSNIGFGTVNFKSNSPFFIFLVKN
jgi:thiamine pyrophosphokinase